MSQERKTSIEQRAQVEQARMKIEGFKIPRGRWRELVLPEDTTRFQLRMQLARGYKYVTPEGVEIEGTIAVQIMEGSIRKLQRRKKNG